MFIAVLPDLHFTWRTTSLKDVPGHKFTLLAKLSQDQSRTNTNFNVIDDTDVSSI